MATKKTTKVSKKADEVKTIDQLKTDLATKTNDLLEARRGNAAGELTNPRVITHLRKDIARINHAIRVQEMLNEKETK